MSAKYDPIYNIGAFEIQQYQQNRYPLFFLDMVEEAIPGEYVKAYKNFTFNEWFFPAHFVDEPNVPGFIQVEIMAQTFIMTFLTLPEYKGKKTGFISINNCRFRKKMIPGDRLDLEARLDSFRRGLAKGHVEGYIGGELACSLALEVAIPEVMIQFKPKPAMDAECPGGGGCNSLVIISASELLLLCSVQTTRSRFYGIWVRRY